MLEFSINSPKQAFERHLNLPGNDRIVFSGKFGSGKTYFLRKFFKNNEKYDVIHLFPVNYSVASNKDVFELIKYDILFELLGKPVEFRNIQINYIETFLSFARKNSHNILAPFLTLIPVLGKSFHTIYKSLQQLSEEYLEQQMPYKLMRPKSPKST